MLPVISKVQKYVDGRIAFLNASDVVIAIVSQFSEVRRNAQKDGFSIFDNGSGKEVLLFVANLTHYKIDPAAQVAFSSNMFAWWKILIDLFIPVRYPTAISGEIVNGSTVAGGSVTEALNNLATAIPIYPKTAASGTYNALTTDYHIYITANNTNIILPLIAANLDREYVIWVGNFTGCTLTCNVADNIIGLANQPISVYTSVTAKVFISNQWLIG
jgi:hypothetical protein